MVNIMNESEVDNVDMINIFFSGSVPFIIVIIALFQKIEWRRQIKKQARSYFQKGSWLKFSLCLTISVLGMLLVSTLVGSFFSFFGFLISLFGMAIVSYGTIDVMTRIRRGQEFELSDFFPTDQMGAVVGLYFVKGLYLFLWSLLLAIPGMIKAYSYSQAMFILNDNPGIGIDEAITRSREMMNGHKWELVILQSSFLGWAILGVMTVGLAIIYILPIYTMSMFVFYDYVKNGYLKSNQYDNVYTIY